MYVPILKLVTLTKSMTYEHSAKFSKNILSVQYQLQRQYMSLLQHIISGPVCLIFGISFASDLKISESDLLTKCVPHCR